MTNTQSKNQETQKTVRQQLIERLLNSVAPLSHTELYQIVTTAEQYEERILKKRCEMVMAHSKGEART
jgi:hypothetical protein